MVNLSTKSALVYDHGCFLCVAEVLARSFGKVFYYCPWKAGLPRSCKLMVGRGFPNVERVANFYDHVAEADCIVFPDVGDHDLQDFLRDHGYRVWGGGRAEKFELDRLGMRQLMKKLGLKTPVTDLVTGIDNLHKVLSERDDLWVKTSAVRGDFETWHHDTYATSKTYLDRLRCELGGAAGDYGFVVEESIDPDSVEAGHDGWVVDGQFSSPCGLGYEIKSRSYVGKVVEYDELPGFLREENEMFVPYFRKYKSRMTFSFETKYFKDGSYILLDPCCRSFSPPIDVFVELFRNYAECVWEGAGGVLIRPEAAAKYYVEAMIHTAAPCEQWYPVKFDAPENDRKWVKLRQPAIVDGQLYHVPFPAAELESIGSVSAIGDDLDDTIALCKERIAKTKGHGLHIEPAALDEAEAVIERGREYGIEF